MEHALAGQVLAAYDVDLDVGLSAEQVDAAERLYGFNELASNPGPPMWRLVLKQFDDLMVKILLAAAALDLLIAWGNGEGLGSLVEPGVILLILAANATVGVVTETNAAQAIEALKALEAEHALVLRGGAWRTLPAREVMPGDVVEVSPGSKVPADVRVARLHGPQLRVDQSILTGESGSVRKDAEALRRAQAVVQDRTNILFGGTVVTAGRAACVAVATGSRSAMGAIRDAVAAQAEGETPLQKRLDELGVVLAKIITAICVAVWLLSLPHFSDPAHGSWLAGGLYYFKVAVALAVAAIPEGLPAVVTTCLALGTRAMAQRGAIVRRLPSVETLGCTTVICCDKTGTLTSNQMAVSHIVVLESAEKAGSREAPPDPPADPPRESVSSSVWSWRGA
ncbi:E1-E2 ATPase, partial [Helicosporidium sp. ATCC 50920]